MKVTSAAYTVVADKSGSEVALLSGGFRLTMTGKEASALRADLGNALQYLYGDCPEQNPSTPAAASVREEPGATTSASRAGNTGLEAVIDYARRPHPSPTQSSLCRPEP